MGRSAAGVCGERAGIPPEYPGGHLSAPGYISVVSKSDRAAMADSVEARCPFLGRRGVESGAPANRKWSFWTKSTPFSLLRSNRTGRTTGVFSAAIRSMLRNGCRPHEGIFDPRPLSAHLQTVQRRAVDRTQDDTRRRRHFCRPKFCPTVGSKSHESACNTTEFVAAQKCDRSPGDGFQD